MSQTDDFSSRAKRCQSLFCIVFAKSKSHPWGENRGFLEHVTVPAVNALSPTGAAAACDVGNSPLLVMCQQGEPADNSV